jgi:UDP-2,4-diacetamido-2,4,6-trideoxy-beta-L-altropyranose hydrolase
MIIRADASVSLGAGHVMRCLALAQGWRRHGGQTLFVQAESLPSLAERLKREGMEVARLDVVPGSVQDAEAVIGLARLRGASWVVADGYRFDAEWQKNIKDAGLRLLLWDDYGHALHYHADVVLNQNVDASASLYERRDEGTRLLLGPRYVQLRSEFLERRKGVDGTPKRGRRVLVTMGGCDADDNTGKVVQALASLIDIESVIVAGAGNPHLAELQESVLQLPTPARLVVDEPNMADLMMWADVAISAAGSTCYEMALLGLPAIVLIAAENQESVARGLHACGSVISLGGHGCVDVVRLQAALVALLDDADRRIEMANNGRAIIDGDGVKRVLMHLLGWRIWLRETEMRDAKFLWNLANLPDVRCASFSMEFIPWEVHIAWLAEKLQKADAMLCVAMSEGDQPVGRVRIEKNSTGLCEISIAVVPEFRGRGLAVEIVRQACEEYRYKHGPVDIHAFIKNSNLSSQSVFVNGGFKKITSATGEALVSARAVEAGVTEGPT